MARKALLVVLALALFTATPALAQNKPASKKATSLDASASASAAPGFAGFGQRWNSMSDKEHDSFLNGMLTAFRNFCLDVTAGDSSKDPQEVNKNFMTCFATHFPYQPAVVKQALNELYKDKANNIIPFDYMYGMALLKVKGDPIDDKLVKLRQVSEKAFKSMK
jgi:hypothetical protein